MSFFVLQEIFLISIAIIVFLVIRKLPQVDGFDVFTGIKSNKNKFGEFTHVLVEKFDNKVAQILEKMLRRMKVIVMKLDNIVSKSIRKTSSKNNQIDSGSNNIFIDAEDDNFKTEEDTISNIKDNDKTDLKIEEEIIEFVEKNEENDNIKNL